MSTYANLENSKTRHANSAVVTITIDGQVYRIAELTGITVRESGGTDPTHAVGTAEPLEHLHNRYSCQVSVQRFLWRETAMRKFNISQRGLLDLENFDFHCSDDVDSETLFSIIGCTLADRSQAIQANSRLMQEMSFLALRTQNAETSTSTRTGVVNPNTQPIDQPIDQPVMAFLDLFPSA